MECDTTSSSSDSQDQSSPYRSPLSSPLKDASSPVVCCDPESSPIKYMSSPSRDPCSSPLTTASLNKRKEYEILEPGVPNIIYKFFCTGESTTSALELEQCFQISNTAADDDMCFDDNNVDDAGAGDQDMNLRDRELTESSSEQSSSERSSVGNEDDQSQSSSEEERLESSHSCSNPESSFSSENEQNDSDSESNNVGVVSPQVYEGCSLTVDEGVLVIMNLFLKHKMEKTALGSILKGTLQFLPRIHQMPRTQYSLLKYVLDLCPISVEKVHFYCSDCHYYLGEKDMTCNLCNGSSKKFYQLPLADQIKNLFENHNLADEIDKYAAKRQAAGDTNGKYRDLCDGTVMRNVINSDSRYNLTLVGHTDGLSISESSNVSVWPLEFVIAELPPHLRYKYVIVSGIWIDETKPNINSFLKPFVEEITPLHSCGVRWVHPKTKEEHTSTITVPMFIADAPVRAQLQNILSHGGKHCCNICEQKMKKLPSEPLQEGVKQKKRRRVYTFEDEPTLRTAERMKAQGEETRRKQEENRGKLKAVKGVRGSSILSYLPGCDRSTAVFPEYMHLLLCLIKHLMKIWFENKGPWNLADKQDMINDFLSSIRVPDFITRIPRSTEYFSKWKANEFRSFLLYYSVIIFSRCMQAEYFQHWMLLVMSLFLLLQESVTENDISRANILLKMFCNDFSKLYKNDFYTYYVHNIVHLPLSVKRNGPLWSHSAFQFENFNGTLVKFIHGSHHQGQELINNVRLAFGVGILEARVSNLSVTSTEHSSVEFKNCVQKCRFTDAEAALLSSMFEQARIKVYYRAKIGHEVYTCKIYKRQKKRNNFTICYFNQTTKNHEYGEIKYFIEASKTKVALVQQFDLNHMQCFLHADSGIVLKHIIPITMSNKIHLVKINDICHKVIRVDDNLCLRPNRYEVNL